MKSISTLIAEGGTKYIISQIISILASIVLLSSFQMKKHRTIVAMQAVAGLLFGIQYFLIGAYVGAACNVVAMVRSSAYAFRGKSKFVDSIACPIFFAVIVVVVNIFTYSSPASLLPITAMVISSFVLWDTKTQQLRAMTLPTSFEWLIYNFICGSYVACVTELLDEASICVGLYRYRRKRVGGSEAVTDNT